MNKLVQTFMLCLSVVSALPASDYWAVLVAGSKGFYNYRHQADVCHSYHLIKAQGIPEEQIIVMLYNDAAWDHENPLPGTLYNKQNGKNYYEGCKIDYHGDELNKDNFFAILTGNSKELKLADNSNSTRKVLKSDENSKLFLFFCDHGAPGHIMFPDSVIYADDLNKTFMQMHENKMYGEFVVFIEACESGSLFQNMNLESINIWALTATNATSPSYGTYCFPHD
jgi:legumain